MHKVQRLRCLLIKITRVFRLFVREKTNYTYLIGGFIFDMIISINQPYFAPFPGFFSKAMRSDILVLLDSVQFPLGSTWLTRNRFKNHQGILRLIVPVRKKGLGLQKINEVRIFTERNWTRKHLESLKTAYAKAPFFDEHLKSLEKIFSESYEKLIDVNLAIIRYLTESIRIQSKIVLLSEIGIEEKEPQLSVEICRKLGASHFLAQSGARKYIATEAFKDSGIEPIFFNYRPVVYPQLWGAFERNLSAFDLLFNCGPKSFEIIRKGI